jgi:putative ABC transport system substrate-binding protein
MRRRDFIKMIGGAAVGCPLAVLAQEPGRVYRLAFMVPSPRQGPAAIAFFDELRRNGFIEGQNLAVVPDGFDVDYGHLPELAAVLVKAAPDAIIAGPARALQALCGAQRKATGIAADDCARIIARRWLVGSFDRAVSGGDVRERRARHEAKPANPRSAASRRP